MNKYFNVDCTTKVILRIKIKIKKKIQYSKMSKNSKFINIQKIKNQKYPKIQNTRMLKMQENQKMF